MKNITHVSAAEQPVQTGDLGGDEYSSMICTGYHVNDRPGPGMPYIQHYVWWDISCAPSGWYMNHPTDSGIIPVPSSLNIMPTFETQEAIDAQEEFNFSA